MVITPYFTEYRIFIEGAGAQVLEVPAAKGTFLLDLDAIEAALTPRVKGIVINSPNNPSGVVYPRENLEGLGRLLRRKGEEYGAPIYLISDEPYREVVYDGVEVPWVPHCYVNTLVCYSYSKAISLPASLPGNVTIYHAGDRLDENGQLVTSGGRVLGVTATGPTLRQALHDAYAAARAVDFDGKYLRHDIGQRALRALKG